MRKYLYNYQTIIRFSSPVRRHSFLLRCMPCENECQHVVRRELFLNPSDYLTHGADAWGNPVQYGSREEGHDSFVFVSCGEVWLEEYSLGDGGDSGTTKTSGTTGTSGPAGTDTAVFLASTSLTACSDEMKTLLAEASGTEAGTRAAAETEARTGAAARTETKAETEAGTAAAAKPESNLEKALKLSRKLHSRMQYTPGATTPATTAAQAYSLKQGVCQDYAHILISLCRECGIAARYADGFMQGEGQTHAWVEILDQGRWRGIDPTNNCLIQYGYIKLAHGRDASDCPVNRGSFTGTATQQTEIRVIVEEI